jgi:hypothetical protein
MTDLLTKVKWALRARKENFALDEDLEHLAHDMARVLIAAGELANVIECAVGKADDGKAAEALDMLSGAKLELARFRAAMEGRTDD